MLEIEFLGYMERFVRRLSNPTTEMVEAGNEAIMTFASVEYIGVSAAKSVLESMMKVALEQARNA